MPSITGVITDTDVFDSAFEFIKDNSSSTLKLYELDYGANIQNLSIPLPFVFQTYSNRLLIVSTKERVLIYKYMNDTINPIADDNGNDSTTWIIIVCVVVAALIIGGGFVFFIRKKKLAQRNSALYGKLND
jgi:hypothetical protein